MWVAKVADVSGDEDCSIGTRSRRCRKRMHKGVVLVLWVDQDDWSAI